MTSFPIPRKLWHVLDPGKEARYRCAHGGRGSGKTYTFALAAALRAATYAAQGRSGVILCCREFQNSLSDSSFAEVRRAIESNAALASNFDIGSRYIKTIDGRVSFLFSGLRHNIDSIKSKAGILIAWVDEAESVSEEAWSKLVPTVREPGSEIWATWNPETKGSPVDARFRQYVPDDALVTEVNHDDNPWFPGVLERARLADRERLDPNTYAWIWEGAYLENSERQVFHGRWQVSDFAPASGWDGPYYGLDYGFSQDPTACVEVWIHDQTLYVHREAGGVGMELDDTADIMREKMPGIERHVIRADSARPESTSYLRRHGLPRVTSVKKWAGSVEDGIATIRNFRSVQIHSTCREMQKEARLYEYKVDRLTGDIKTTPVDANNHYWDAVRYAIEPLMKRRSKGFFG